MATIVEYTTEKRARNAYPKRIVSPPSPSSCCATQMEQVGEVEREDSWSYVYKRCKTCGFTVRHFLPVPRLGDPGSLPGQERGQAERWVATWKDGGVRLHR